TFFLTQTSSLWSDIAANGHELGSHTYNHPCSIVGNESWMSEANSSESYDLDRMAAELDEQLTALSELGQNAPYSFAYPCGTTWVGDHTSYMSVVDERFIGARGVSGSVVTSMTTPLNVSAYFITDETAAYTEVVDNAIAAGGLAVFGFHDIGAGGTMPVSVEAHDGLLAYLDANRDSVTVLTFGQAVQCMLER
ncbi:MAG: polysaccharide deacetylase family protein, partial [Deltaproteobacteria bacterium]|nr:polysaccharide deacetylase family protein [Deltaproteobacteria bacterium]